MTRTLIFCLTMMTLLWPHESVAQAVTYQPEDSIFIEKALQEGGEASTLRFARKLIGRPYVAHTLEVNDEEQLVVNTRQLDCTTLVETVVALTMCAEQGLTSFADYTRTLTKLRYRHGQLTDYTSRLHYFSDWILDNEADSIVTEIHGPIPPFTAIQRLNVNYMSLHPKAYKALSARPDYVKTISKQEQNLTGRTFRFIPKNRVLNSPLLRKTIKNGDIIAITCNKPGLEIAHLGFAVWRADGLHLLNASQLHKRVVEEPMTLGQYLRGHKSHTGIRIVRLSNERLSNSKENLSTKK